MSAEHAAVPLHCVCAFDSLRKAVDPSYSGEIEDSFDNFSSPLFVTWHTTEHGKEMLRGCIGILKDTPIKPGIASYAVIAGTRDHRFPPIAAHELPHLNVCVSMLVKWEDAASVQDWAVGTHGITISWDRYSAIFLPEVAPEQEWDVDTTVKHLIRKAGYNGAITPELLAGIKCVKFQSSRALMDYAEYTAFKNE